MIYQLGDAARSVVNLAFGLLGVWMAHSFYRSTRKRYVTIFAWLLAFTYCGLAAELVKLLGWLPQSSHEHISNIVGFGAVFAYLYLFTNIPAAQRIFTYFFIDNCMYILVLLARLSSLWLHRLLPLGTDALFVLLFTLYAAGFMLLFFKRLRRIILDGLSAFRNQLPILTVYACVCYVAMLALVDAWAPMAMPGPARTFGLLSICATAVCGYVLVFYVLRAIRTAQASAVEAEMLHSQLALSRQYYQSLVDSIERDRALRHDFSHHLRALEGMWTHGDTEKLGAYLSSLIAHGESAAPARYCECYAANVLLDYFCRQATREGIRFKVDAVIPEWDDGMRSPHLSVVLGNLMQNALEACLRQPPEADRYIALLSRVVNGSLTIEVENSFDGVLLERDGQLLSRKAEDGHGLGLGSVRNAAAACGGFFRVSHEAGIFRAQAVLNLQGG